MKAIDIIKNSFMRVKQDMILIKQSLHEWALYLHGNQQLMQQKIDELEARVRELETQNISEEFRMK